MDFTAEDYQTLQSKLLYAAQSMKRDWLVADCCRTTGGEGYSRVHV